MSVKRPFRPGDIVEVRSLEEILATLDEKGTLEGVPFMPEMAAFCGRRFPFGRTANRTCEEGTGGMRRMPGAVFLEDVRCDGSAHDGCQRDCLIFWKTAWLRRPDQDRAPTGAGAMCSVEGLRTKDGDRYVCQSTELKDSTSPMRTWDLRPLLGDLVYGEVSLRTVIRVLSLTLWNKLVTTAGKRGGITRLRGEAKRTSRETLGLETGDRVRVKSREEIAATLNAEGRNRGLSFEYDMIPYCGRTFEVAYPIRKIILEATGEMISMSDTVVLEGVVCEGLLRRSCPRQNYLFWREAWLSGGAPAQDVDDPGAGR